MTHPSNHKKDQIVAAYHRLRDQSFNLSMIAREAGVSIGIFANYKDIRDEIMAHPNYGRSQSRKKEGTTAPQREQPKRSFSPVKKDINQVKSEKRRLAKTAKEWINFRRFTLFQLCYQLAINFDSVLYDSGFAATRREIWQLAAESRSRFDSKNQPRKEEE